MTEKLIDENKGALKRTGRKGQSEYRRKVLDYMPQCPFTLIKDDVLLKQAISNRTVFVSRKEKMRHWII